jgi:hypothetical protein
MAGTYFEYNGSLNNPGYVSFVQNVNPGANDTERLVTLLCTPSVVFSTCKILN